MPARPESAPQQHHQPAMVPTPWPYPNIPQQRSGPAYESVPPPWFGPPPAGLSAPIPIPKTHPIRNAFLGATALLVVFIVLVCVAPLTSFAPSTGSGTTIEAWRDSGGLDRLNALANDLSAAVDAARAQDVDSVSTACVSLRSDTEAAQAYAPIPDAEAQAHWAAALAHLAQGSTNCVTALRSQDASLFIKASDEINAVPADISQVVSRLTALNQ